MYFRGHLYLPENGAIGPAPVPDDDGQEHVLVHVVGMNGEWLWSSIEIEYIDMDDLQVAFDKANPQCDDDTYWLLMWEEKEMGPYPSKREGPDRALPSLFDFSFSAILRYVNGVQRSVDTQEVFITACKMKHSPSYTPS